MLKKFLKFLRGDSEDPEQFEGSYLSEVLSRIQPRMVEELEECPEHDPLPLAVAEILKETGGEKFDHELECPVTDSESPSLDPPAPPPAPDAPPSEAVEESEDSEKEQEEEQEKEADTPEESANEDEPDEEEVAAEEVESSEESSDQDDCEHDGGEVADADVDDEDDGDGDDVDDEEAEQADVDVDDEDDGDGDEEGGAGVDDDAQSVDDDSDAEDSKKEESLEDEEEPEEKAQEEEEGEETVDEGVTDLSDDDDTDEYTDVPGDLVDGASAREREQPGDDIDTDVYEVEAAVDVETNRAADEQMLGESETTDAVYARVDSQLALEMGRVFLGMLVENDRLPVELQMSPGEINEARELLAGYFLGADGLESRAREMLRLVEDKFDEGLFSQARILLQLFDADEGTRIENDRNLFYEEMILRFGIQRRHPVGEGICQEFEERLGGFGDGSDELDELFAWLDETLYVTFDVYGKDSRETEAWRSIAELSERPGAVERLLDVIPPSRWRLLGQFSDSAIDMLEAQFTEEYVAEYINEHIKTCYFILRAVGDTGLEPYLDVFFDWIDEEFGVDGPGMMPWIYNETTANERLVEEIFDDLYEERFCERVQSQREAWSREELEQAVEDAVEQLSEADLGEIPPGHYDFGRFVLDQLFEIEYPTGEFPYKMHRIT